MTTVFIIVLVAALVIAFLVPKSEGSGGKRAEAPAAKPDAPPVQPGAAARSAGFAPNASPIRDALAAEAPVSGVPAAAPESAGKAIEPSATPEDAPMPEVSEDAPLPEAPSSEDVEFVYGGVAYVEGERTVFAGSYVNRAYLPAAGQKCIQFNLRCKTDRMNRHDFALITPDGREQTFQNVEIRPGASIAIGCYYQEHTRDMVNGFYNVTCDGAPLARFCLTLYGDAEGGRYPGAMGDWRMELAGVAYNDGGDNTVAVSGNRLVPEETGHDQYSVALRLRNATGVRATHRAKLVCESTGRVLFTNPDGQTFEPGGRYHFYCNCPMDVLPGEYTYYLDDVPAYRFAVGPMA